MKIIVCDDNLVRRSRLVAFLSNSDIAKSLNVVVAGCADEVVRLLTTDYYDALVLDIVIPKRANENPLAYNGSQLLTQICRGRRLQKPERLIAITGYLDDIQEYRKSFADFGVAVVEAKDFQGGWEQVVLDSMSYTVESQTFRSLPRSLNVVTVHGIRTYGEWQRKFRDLVAASGTGVSFHTHKYGYFSALAFLVPSWRRIEVDRLVSQLVSVFNKSQEARFAVFCHSFGTFLVAHALEELCRQGYRNVQRLILSGSVLNSDYDWRFLISCGVEVINDCAQDDLVLWASEAIVLQTGMAGKVGFYGIENQQLTNRFIRGGHSEYFRGSDFMRDKWVPLLDVAVKPESFDERVSRGVLYESMEGLIRGLGRIKKYVYVVLFLLILYQLKRIL
jgi:CheY-like chemotaxis protein